MTNQSSSQREREILGLSKTEKKSILCFPPAILILPRSANSFGNLEQSFCITLLQ